jgi:hypothetical protein
LLLLLLPPLLPAAPLRVLSSQAPHVTDMHQVHILQLSTASQAAQE